MNVIQVDFRKKSATPAAEVPSLAIPAVDQQLGDICNTVAALSKNMADLRAIASEEAAALDSAAEAEISLREAVESFGEAVETMGGLMDRYLQAVRSLNG